MDSVSEFIEKTVEATTERDVFTALATSAANTGSEFCAIAEIIPTYLSVDKPVEHNGLLNFPDKWVTAYDENSWSVKDPIVRHAMEIQEPMAWSELKNGFDLSKKERDLMVDAAGCGLRNGMTIGLNGSMGYYYVFSFASEDNAAPSATTLRESYSLAVLALNKMNIIKAKRAKAETLTVRQIECLYWSANGKSSWEIGRILGISENTVNFHMKECLRKLDTSNRTVAAIRCVSMGLLRIDQG